MSIRSQVRESVLRAVSGPRGESPRGDRPDATSGQLIEAVRSVGETRFPDLRDYPAALGYLAEAYALNRNYPKAVEEVQRGLALTPQTKPAELPSKLRQWLEGSLAEYRAKAHPRET